MQEGYRALGVMEKHLARHDFFAANTYTIADIALYAVHPSWRICATTTCPLFPSGVRLARPRRGPAARRHIASGLPSRSLAAAQ